jgi:hypothetical protein
MVAHIGVSGAQRRLQDYLDAANDAIAGERNAGMLQGFADAFFSRA